MLVFLSSFLRVFDCYVGISVSFTCFGLLCWYFWLFLACSRLLCWHFCVIVSYAFSTVMLALLSDSFLRVFDSYIGICVWFLTCFRLLCWHFCVIVSYAFSTVMLAFLAVSCVFSTVILAFLCYTKCV